MARLSIPVLTDFIADLLTRAGLTPQDAGVVAGVLVGQESRGITTHGLRLVEYHVSALAMGLINTTPNIQVLRDDAAMVVFDTDNTVGIVGVLLAMDAAIERAQRFGIGIAIAAYSNYSVSCGPYCLHAAEKGMLGITMSNTRPAMGYPGAQGRVIGNNPLGFAAPTGAGFPILYDAAMTISNGMLSRLIRQGLSMPAGLIGHDAEGKPTQEPKDVRTPMPIGLHKGAGLALLVEILTGVLSGGAFLQSVDSGGARKSKADSQSQCCIAVDIERFMPLTDFCQRMQQLVLDLKDNPLAPGASEIRLPGERMARHLEQSRRDGVVIEPDVSEYLNAQAKQVGATSPL